MLFRSGLGPKRVEALNESGIQNIGDLLYYFPRTYIDRSKLHSITDLEKLLGQTCTINATIKRVRYEPGRKSRLRVLVDDGTGEMELIWFQGGHLYRNKLQQGQKYLITGKVVNIKDDEITKRIFGDYVSRYDFKRSVDDGATVPLYYENRGEYLKLKNPNVNEQIREILDSEGGDLDIDQRNKVEQLMSN